MFVATLAAVDSDISGDADLRIQAVRARSSFSTRQQGTVYVDAVKDGQPVLTRDLDMKNGQAELNLTATPELAGTVDSTSLCNSPARATPIRTR
jgi:hypothetical protein